MFDVNRGIAKSLGTEDRYESSKFADDEVIED